jgi:hypothetical protein
MFPDVLSVDHVLPPSFSASESWNSDNTMTVFSGIHCDQMDAVPSLAGARACSYPGILSSFSFGVRRLCDGLMPGMY